MTINQNDLNDPLFVDDEWLEDTGGIGQLTGNRYQLVGVTLDQEDIGHLTSSAYEFSRTIITKVIGQGPGNNSTMHALMHTTVNANGDVTVSINDVTDECK